MESALRKWRVVRNWRLNCKRDLLASSVLLGVEEIEEDVENPLISRQMMKIDDVEPLKMSSDYRSGTIKQRHGYQPNGESYNQADDDY